jgi:hypothetical protein
VGARRGPHRLRPRRAIRIEDGLTPVWVDPPYADDRENLSAS